MTMDKTFYNLLFQQDIVTIPSYFQMFFFIAFLDKAFIKNIITLCINHIIIICINDNNSVINNIYGRYENLICSSKFPWSCEWISSEFVENLGMCPKKGSPALSSVFSITTFYILPDICFLVSQVLQQQLSTR